MDAITKGADWSCDVTVDPGSGSSVAAVVTALTGASVTAELELFGEEVTPAPSAAVQSAEARTIRISYTAAETALLDVGDGYLLDVRITTSGAATYPVEILELVRVRS
jgi:hypothetical protein